MINVEIPIINYPEKTHIYAAKTGNRSEPCKFCGEIGTHSNSCILEIMMPTTKPYNSLTSTLNTPRIAPTETKELTKTPYIDNIICEFYNIVRNDYTLCYGNEISGVNTIYILKSDVSYNPVVTGCIRTTFSRWSFDSYEDLMVHLELPSAEIYNTKVVIDLTVEPTNVKTVLLNGRLIGYYIPSINSFILGDVTWHKDYVGIILRSIWQQILRGLKN